MTEPAGIEFLAGHAIWKLTAQLSNQRAYLVTFDCLCGAVFPDIPSADLSGVLDVGIQAFFSHLAAVA